MPHVCSCPPGLRKGAGVTGGYEFLDVGSRIWTRVLWKSENSVCPFFLFLIPVYYASLSPTWVPKFLCSLFGHGALKWFTKAHAHLTEVVESPVGTQRPMESLALLPTSSLLLLFNFMGSWFSPLIKTGSQWGHSSGPRKCFRTI